MKPGIKTTEFWLTAVVSAVSVVVPLLQQMLAGRSDPASQTVLLVATMLLNIVYIWTRSQQKIANPPGQSPTYFDVPPQRAAERFADTNPLPTRQSRPKDASTL
jgi:hypothetical protein